MKYCPACKKTLRGTEFYGDRCRSDGLASKCKKCDRAMRQRKTPEAVRKYNLKYQFNLPWDNYLLMLQVQERACLVCRRPFGEATPAVDHNRACCPGDRSCGRCIRGLLCRGCNTAAGLLRDDAAIIRRLAAYVAA